MNYKMIQSVNILTTDNFVEDAVGVLQKGGIQNR